MSNLKKHFEAILGRDLVGPEAGLVVVREHVGAYTRDKGQGMSREIGTTGASTRVCRNTDLLDVDGISFTGSDGSVTFLLSDYQCLGDDDSALLLHRPLIVLVTPHSSVPVFTTVETTLIRNGHDARIIVSSWKPNGEPAPRVPFSWRCRAPYELQAIVD